MVSGHTPANGDEPDVKADDEGVQDAIDGALDGHVALLREPIDQETEAEDGKIQCRVVVVHVGDTRHDNKGEIMEEPSSQGIKASIVDLIHIVLSELPKATLPAKNVPNSNETDNTERRSGAPVNERIAKKEVLDDIIIPATHTKTNVQDRPLPPLGGKVVLLIGIRDQGVVGSHHGNIQMDEIVEEGGSVDLGVTRRNY